MVLIDVEAQRKRNAERDKQRQEIVKEIVRKIDEIILFESDRSTECTCELVRRVATELSEMALNYGAVFKARSKLTVQVSDVLHDILFRKPLKAEVVREWILMQVAKRFVEKAAIPFADRLREYDRVN